MKTETIFKTQEHELKFEDIGTRVMRIKKGYKGWLIPALILIFLSIVMLFARLNGTDLETGAEFLYFSFGLVCGLCYILTFKNVILLTGSNPAFAIEFSADRNKWPELEEFIGEIVNKRKKYLLARYRPLNAKLLYETQYNNLTWLFDNYVLDKNEYEKSIEELDYLFPADTIVRRFSFGTN